jgi:undecaprenyl-diphosphatase
VLDLIKVILLGIVEGVTEFLPVSSTGHLIVAVALLRPGFSEAFSNIFEIFIQLGAVVAVVAYYRVDLWRQVRAAPTDRQVQHFWLALLIAFIPAALVGLALRSTIKTYLFSPLTVAITLILGGIAFIIIERRLQTTAQQPSARPTTDDLMNVNFRQALVVGVVQTLSLIPGVSRSASSIFGGLLAGLNRETATRFSFYLMIPTLGLATVVDLLLSLDDLQGGDLIYLLVGTIVSAVVAWVAVGWLVRYIARHTFVPFGYYRIIAGIVILVLTALAVL